MDVGGSHSGGLSMVKTAIVTGQMLCITNNGHGIRDPG